MRSLKSIYQQFQTEGTFATANPFGSGHINDTYLATTVETECPNYIIQRFNGNIFKNIPALMNNIVLITEHIKNKLRQELHANLQRECLTVILNHQQQAFYQDADNQYWACYLYIDNSLTYDLAKTTQHAYEGGKILGRFLNFVSDFPQHLLHETLPNFHNVQFRLQHFTEALSIDSLKRATSARVEIDFIEKQAENMQYILRLGQQNQIPQRIIHNDTKFNNILFDTQGNGLCMIDLDTVMPGYIHYDYSDAIRTIANNATEDEADLTKIEFNLDLFKAFTQGFLPAIKHAISTKEIEALAPATALLPFMIGLRFLTDYLNGDIYFKTHFPLHNLQRARAQLQLVKSIQTKMPQIKDIIESLAIT